MSGSVNNDVPACLKCYSGCTIGVCVAASITMFVLGILALHTNYLPGVSTGGAYALAILGGGTAVPIGVAIVCGLAGAAFMGCKKCVN